MSKARVSVVIPVYNNEKYVEACIRSLQAQTHEELQLLVIDDGSSDGSGAILEKLAAEDARITLIRQENHGVSYARNQGLDQADGEYLTFVDGDDYLGKTYIEDLLSRAQTNGADMVLCGYTMVDEEGKELTRVVPTGYERGKKEEWPMRISAVCSHFYKRSLWEKYHMRFHTEGRGEDLPISLFFAAAAKNIAVLPKADYFYVQHPGSASSQFKGLKKIGLPYKGLEESIQRIRKLDTGYDRSFHELFVLRILASCISLAKGASKEERVSLGRYIHRILETYYPDYRRNPRTSLFSGLEIPFFQKASVRFLIFLEKHGQVEGFLTRFWG